MNPWTTSGTPARNWGGRLLTALKLGLAGLAAYFAVRMGIAILAPESVWEVQSSAPAGTPVPKPAASTVQLDTSFDPFHRGQASTKDEIIEVGTDAPETTLNLKMVGRRTGPNGSAILQTANGEQKRYGIGDEITNGVTLKAVNSDYIVLAQGGRIERLSIARSGEDSLIQSGAAGKNAKAKSPLTLKTAAADISPSMRGQISAGEILSAISLSRIVDKGAVKGYRIMPKEGFDLTPYRLQPGDIISQIGPVDLTAPGFNPAQLGQALASSEQIRVKILRGQQTLFLNYDE